MAQLKGELGQGENSAQDPRRRKRERNWCPSLVLGQGEVEFEMDANQSLVET